MRLWLVALVLCLSTGLPVAAQKGKTKKGGPEVQIVNLRVQRDGGVIALEGKVKNVSEKTLRGLVVFFEFLEPGGQMISRMTTQVTDEEMKPGDEGEFLTQTPDPVRAVHIRLDAEDTQGRYLKVDKPGPHVID